MDEQKKKSPRKGKAGKKGVADASRKTTREAAALRARERKAAKDAAEDIKKEESAAVVAAMAGRKSKPGDVDEFRF